MGHKRPGCDGRQCSMAVAALCDDDTALSDSTW